MNFGRRLLLRSCIVQVGIALVATSARADLAGLWEFEDPGDLTKATIGSDLVLTGTDAAIAGSGGIDTGATQVGVGSYYTSNHGIAANGGGSYVNEYTIVFDISYPASSDGLYKSLYQTNTSNSNDGDLFIHDGTDATSGSDYGIGIGAMGYSAEDPPVGIGAAGKAFPDTWYRVVLAMDNGTSNDVYVDGQKWLTGAVQSIDGRFSLDPVVLFLADNDEEDPTTNLSNLAIYDFALTAAQAASLGGAGREIPNLSAVPEPATLVTCLLLATGLAATRSLRRKTA